MQLKTLTSSLLLIISSSVMANNSDNVSGIYGSVGSVSFDAQVSTENSVDDSATYFKLGWENHQENMLWGVGLSGYSYSDNAGFTNNTTDGVKSSEATALNGYFEAGYKYNINDNVNLSILAGYEHVFSSERGIGLCDGCDSEDIDISAGLYIQPRVTFITESNWYISGSYNAYLGGDVESALFLTVGMLY